MNYNDRSVEEHIKNKGKLEISSKVSLDNMEDLSIYYTPGIAEPCRRIAENPEEAYKLTPKGNSVAIVTDGSAVLGLGDIGPAAAYPVMEGKAILFKKFAGIDAFPFCVNADDSKDLINIIKKIAHQFGAVNLEDISAPKCFELEKSLNNILPIPVFHDDQHGTAVVVLAGLINALKVCGKDKNIKIVVNGAGAAGLAVTELLVAYGFSEIVVCDSRGALFEERENMTEKKSDVAQLTGRTESGSLAYVLEGADVFLGLSVGGILSKDMVRSMADDPVIFAMANPDPEITPEEAKEAGAKIIATGRSDYPNQVNNALAFPGILRGALDNRIPSITENMYIKAAEALANLISSPTPDKIIPSIFDEGVHEAVASVIK